MSSNTGPHLEQVPMPPERLGSCTNDHSRRAQPAGCDADLARCEECQDGKSLPVRAVAIGSHGYPWQGSSRHPRQSRRDSDLSTTPEREHTSPESLLSGKCSELPAWEAWIDASDWSIHLATGGYSGSAAVFGVRQCWQTAPTAHRKEPGGGRRCRTGGFDCDLS